MWKSPVNEHTHRTVSVIDVIHLLVSNSTEILFSDTNNKVFYSFSKMSEPIRLDLTK